MKALLTVIITFLTIPVLGSIETCKTIMNEDSAEEKLEIKTDVPKHLEGATIIIKTADGRESSVPAEKFKVVARKQQFIVTKVQKTSLVRCDRVEKAEKEKNRVSLLAGKGAQEGLDVSRTPTEVTVESRVGLIGGAQYQRLLTDKFSVGAQVQTNKSLLLGVGLDF